MNLMEGMIAECSRVRELLKKYESLPNGAGLMGAMMMNRSLRMAERAMGSGDVTDMLKSYGDLGGYES